MAGDIQPLDQSFAIVKPDGMPTEYFIWWAQQRQIDIKQGITAAQAQQLIDDWAADRDIFAGTGLDGGGPLSADVTIDLADTAVTPGTYGDASNVAQITIDQQGRITAAADVAISGGGGSSSWTLIDQTGAAIVNVTVTITIASPGVVTLTAHGYAANQAVIFTTTGALPTGLTAGTVYYVRNPTANTFEVSATVGGASINTTGTQSGTQSVRKAATWTFSAAAASVSITGITDYSDLMFIARNLTSSGVGNRNIIASVNNGSSYYSASGDYVSTGNNGVESNAAAWAIHDTSSTGARSFSGFMPAAGVLGTPKWALGIGSGANLNRYLVASLDPVNAIQLSSGSGNLTGGNIYVLKR